MKKIIAVLLCVCFMLIPSSVFAEECDINSVPPYEVGVNENYTLILQGSGACGEAVVNISGSYMYYPTENRAGNINLSESVVSYTSDWHFWLDRVTYEPCGPDVKITIRFHFIPTYFDSAFSGGPQYNARTVVFYTPRR